MLNYYMQVAELTADLSRAKRQQVGAIVVKQDRIISIGFNGTPSGWDNECETRQYMQDAGGWLAAEEIAEQWPHIDHDQGRYRLITKPEVLHAEANALMKLASSTESGEGATMFCTHAPCMECAKMVYQAGISELYYRNEYISSKPGGLEFLHKTHMKITHLS